MINSIILCEGSTDFALLQYYMRKVNCWEDTKAQHNVIKFDSQKSRLFVKENKQLTIASMGGCSRIEASVGIVLERNFNTSPWQEDAYHNIVILTDRDEACTEAEIIASVGRALDKYEVEFTNLCCNRWVDCHMISNIGANVVFRILLLVIPFTTEGAIETFLLEAIADKDEYDKQIINRTNSFVEQIDKERRYLNARRTITKAKFDVYFSIRTPVEQFGERQKILINVPWEDYPKIQRDFRLLGDL